ncbi:DUF6517 family protein [Natrialba sp. PRR66]|uniref:DUF6517 family protein n=1 Tax=Natrialba sp. PRR66 TaxID=3098146 RepID=UPI002B1DF917|nr:DUF6517 family protein [Natrialba sp. PRR66]
MKRRTLLSGLGVAGLTSLSGCLGLVGMAHHEASPAGVDASVRNDTGYEQTTIDEFTVEREVGVSIATETVVITNYMTEHEKAVDMGPLGEQRGAVFIVLTTPQVNALGSQFNPVEDMSTDELVELVASNYDDIGSVSFVEETSVTVFDQSTTQSRYTAEASFQGQPVDVALHVSEAIETDDDLLVTVGVYPNEFDWSEEEQIFSLMDGVVPDIDEEDAGDTENGTGESDSDGNDTETGAESDTEGNDTDTGNGTDENGDNEDDGGLLSDSN